MLLSRYIVMRIDDNDDDDEDENPPPVQNLASCTVFSIGIVIFVWWFVPKGCGKRMADCWNRSTSNNTIEMTVQIWCLIWSW